MARAYNYITKHTSPNQNARNAKIAGITIHWWGKPVGQKIDGIVSWLCDKRAGTSAHYVVSSNVVYCIVDPDRRAWHAGNSRANHTQIGIELDPNASKRAGTERTAAALIADLRAVYGDLPLSPHKRWTSTACPGDWDLAALDRRARGETSAPSVPSKPAPTPAGRLAVDGRLGHATVRVMQEWLEVEQDGKAGHDTWKGLQRLMEAPYVDGIISRQSYRPEELGNGITQGWDYTGRGSSGSQTVKAMQQTIGADDDGIWGESTTSALQVALNAWKARR